MRAKGVYLNGGWKNFKKNWGFRIINNLNDFICIIFISKCVCFNRVIEHFTMDIFCHFYKYEKVWVKFEK
jgi:hypothetical protein